MGQTEIEFMDLESQELLREEMLTLLGMTHSPKGAGEEQRKMGNHTVITNTH